MCCIAAVLVFIGPRAGIIVWWLLDPARWQAVFPAFIWPILGFVFAPWTTLAWALVGRGGLTGFDWIWLALGILADISSYSGGAYSRRGRRGC